MNKKLLNILMIYYCVLGLLGFFFGAYTVIKYILDIIRLSQDNLGLMLIGIGISASIMVTCRYQYRQVNRRYNEFKGD